MKKQLVFGIASAVLAMGSVAMADTYSTSTTFGPLNQATFSGTGIPNNPTEVTSITDNANNDQIYLGLTATARYFNPTVNNNGDVGGGTPIFYAGAGLNNGLNPGKSLGATWNFDYFVMVGANNIGNYTFSLLYTTPTGATGTVAIDPFTSGVSQDSENIVFSGLSPYVLGTYTFTLEAFNSASTTVPIGSSVIRVDVVPEVSSSALLFCLTLGGLGVYSRMRRQSVV